jgi:hypothetical protein
MEPRHWDGPVVVACAIMVITMGEMVEFIRLEYIGILRNIKMVMLIILEI